MGFLLTLVYTCLMFVSIGDSFRGLAPYRVQLIIGVAALLATIFGAMLGNSFYGRQVGMNPQYALMAAFTGWVLVSWWPHLWFGGIGVSLDFLPSAFLFFLIALTTGTVRRLHIFRIVLVVTTLYIVAHGLYDYHWVGRSSPYRLVDSVGHGEFDRLKGLGILGDPNQYAQFLLSVLPFLFIGWKKRNFVAKALVLSISGVMIYAISLSRSREGLIGLCFLIFLVLRTRFSALGGAIATVVAGLGLAAVNFTGGREISREGGLDRLACWSEGLGMFKSSPLWGVGFNGFLEHYDHTAHNSFLLCAAELGLIGYFLWIGLILITVWQLKAIRDSTGADTTLPEFRGWASATLMAIYVYLVCGFFLSQTYAPALYMLLGVSAGIIAVDVRTREQRLIPGISHWGLWTAGTCVGSIVFIYFCVISRVL